MLRSIHTGLIAFDAMRLPYHENTFHAIKRERERESHLRAGGKGSTNNDLFDLWFVAVVDFGLLGLFNTVNTAGCVIAVVQRQGERQ